MPVEAELNFLSADIRVPYIWNQPFSSNLSLKLSPCNLNGKKSALCLSRDSKTLFRIKIHGDNFKLKLLENG